jgi:AraC-like DNA-binding protein
VFVAHSEARIGRSGMRSTLLLERAVRGAVVLRDELAFDSQFAAAAAGRLEPVGHVFLMLAGRFIAGGTILAAPVAYVLGDDELERVRDGSRTFRTEGPRAHVIQLRVARTALHAPVGLAHGPLALPPACWDAATRLVDCAPSIDTRTLAQLLDALGAAGALDRRLSATLHADEPPQFQRLWDALQPLYATYGGTASLKQLAASLDMSLRQISRDAKAFARTFGFTSGYRDALRVLRLRTAVLLLSAPDGAIGDVARIVGYGSPIAMARAFRDARLPAPSAIQHALHAE